MTVPPEKNLMMLEYLTVIIQSKYSSYFCTLFLGDNKIRVRIKTILLTFNIMVIKNFNTVSVMTTTKLQKLKNNAQKEITDIIINFNYNINRY